MLKCKKIIKANSTGFTLLETMISMAVFSIGILGLAALQTVSVNNNTLAENVQDNTVIAMSQIEELMATDYNDSRIQFDIPYTYTSDDGKFTITATPMTNQAIPGAKRVIVTSTFTENGISRTTTLKIFKPFISVVTNE